MRVGNIRSKKTPPLSKNQSRVRTRDSGKTNLGTTTQLMQLQRSIGNSAVQRMVAHDALQLFSGEEEELQLKKDETVQRAPLDAIEEEPPVQESKSIQLAPLLKADQEAEQPGAEKKTIPTSGGDKLPEPVQNKMEAAFSKNFSDVRVHQGSSAKDLGALAYTRGNDIHFAPGQYDPETTRGQQLLGHELTHVVQQREGKVEPTTLINGIGLNDDVHLEREADQMGAKVARHI